MTLDQQLRELAEKHGLNAIRVGLLLVADEWIADASVHGGGECAGGGYLGQMIPEALSNALAELQARRSPAVVIPDLEAVA